MALTSQIKVRQISPSELSGFVNGATFSSLSGTGINIGGNIAPTISGLYSLGDTGHYFQNLYTNNVIIPSGNSINFGGTTLSAYTSGNAGILNVGGYTITSTSTALSIIGPSGPSGYQGIQGIVGNSGISVTGYTTSNNKLTFYYSDGTSGNAIQLPSGATGATGAFAIGSYVSGNYVSFIFSNGTTGSAFYIPSGLQGNNGPVGNIYYDFQTLYNYNTGDPNPPYVYLPSVNPSIVDNPPLNFVKGMDYGIGYSGLATAIVSGYNTNYYVDDLGQTGYLQLVFFTSEATPGRYISSETITGYSTIANWLDTNNNPISSNRTFNPYMNQISMSVNFASDSSYYYGFQRYSMAVQAPIDGNTVPGEWGFYVLGQANTNYFGPQGPSGVAGIQGVPGPQGDIGPNGIDGPVGIGIAGVTSNGSSLQLEFSDGSTSQWITLPQGGAQGATGPQGPSGLQGIQGPTGATGAQGYADTYLVYFGTQEINATSGISPSFNKEISGQSIFTYCTGNNMYFKAGDEIQFQHNDLIGKAYSPAQNVLVADSNYSGVRYFYGLVNTFNKTAGVITMTIEGSPYPPIGISGSYMYWNQFNGISMNLGGLGSPGPIGNVGPQGIQGNTGHSIFINTGIDLSTSNLTNIYGSNCDSWSINIGDTQHSNTLNFISSSIATGQTLIIKVYNSGNNTLGDDGSNLLTWQVDSVGGVKWPYGVPAPGPAPSSSSVYTIIRFPDMGGLPAMFGTFSANYS